jgi:hypothetical protein
VIKDDCQLSDGLQTGLCSAAVFITSEPDLKKGYQYLLLIEDFLYPRTDVDSLEAVQRMKPFWTIGPECYGWLDEPHLQVYQECLQDGKVLFGTYEGGEDDE